MLSVSAGVPRGLLRALVAVGILLLAGAAAQAQTLVQTFYVPVEEDDVRTWAGAIGAGTWIPSNDTHVVISVSIVVDGTILYYDHWEDGFETDLANPTQATTLILGDGDASNGAPPGCAVDACDVLNAGDVLVLENDVPVNPRNPADIRFDGSDKFAVTEPVAVTRAGYSTTLTNGTTVDSGILNAGATEMLPTTEWGLEFEVPVGENTTTSNQYEYTAISILAQADGTVVNIDANGDGDFTDPGDVSGAVLNEGETLFVDGLFEGATVEASSPVQATLLTGDPGPGFYESRWFSLQPTRSWSDVYYMPVTTTMTGDEAAVTLYNPGTTDITVTITGMTGVLSTVTVPAGSTAQTTVPAGTAICLDSGGDPFYALATIDVDGTTHDWGFALIPGDKLTPTLVVGWAPGSTDLSENLSPVWVTPVESLDPSDPDPTTTELYVDWEGDGMGALTDANGNQYDQLIVASLLEPIQIVDPNDNDQTGMKIYTCDGTILAGAWGQDPALADPFGAFPALDLGTAVLSFSALSAFKTSALGQDFDGNGQLGPGDTLIYTIRVQNNGIVPLTDVLVADVLDPNSAYLAGTTTVDGVPVGDDATGATVYPLDEGGLNIGTLAVGQVAIVSYEVVIADPLPPGTEEVVNQATATSGVERTTSSVVDPIPDPGLEIQKTSDVGAQGVLPGETITYTAVLTNTGDQTLTGIAVTDPAPAGTSYVAESTSVSGFSTTSTSVTLEDVDTTGGDINGTTTSCAAGDFLAVPFNVTTDLLVTDVDLGFVASHTFRGDIQLTLVSPTGTRIELITADTSAGGNPHANYDLLLDDDIGGPLNDGNADNVASPFYERTASPSNPLSGFDGESSLGVWTIEICDAFAAADNGDYLRSQLTIAGDQIGPTTKTNQTGSPDPLVDGTLPNLVVAADGFVLAPGESMTITYEVLVDSPLDPSITQILNTVSATTTQTPDPVEDSVVDPVSPGGSIGDTVWLDTDGDGVQDAGEEGIANVTLYLCDAATAVCDATTAIATTTTDANGNYVFDGLAPGDYQVQVDTATVPTGLTESPGNVASNSGPVSLAAGAEITDIDFGYTAPADSAVIGDYIWSDADGDGIQDAGEPGIGGVVVNLIDPVTGAVVATATTSPDGSYLFDGVAAGEYTVQVDPSNFLVGGALEGAVDTAGPQSQGSGTADPNDDVSDPISVSGGDVYVDGDFGYVLPGTFSVTDTVWNDVNGDGVLDPGESGIPGVTVDLVDPVSGDVIATATTDANGVVTFDGVPEGSYEIQVTDLDGVLDSYATTTTAAAAGSTAVTVDAAADAADGTVDGVVSGENFGYNKPGFIGDTIFLDADGNGTQDPGEMGIGGVTVNLLDPVTGAVIATTATASDGTYSFSGVEPGAYTVQVDETTLPAGLTASSDPDGVPDSQSSSTVPAGGGDLTQDFGYTDSTPASVSGTVFNDPDADGVEEAGEPGIPGVTVALIPNYTVIDGAVDLNGDGVIDGADDGGIGGIAIIDGLFDTNGDGVVDANDDGQLNGIPIIDGQLDLNGDGVIDATDDGSVAGDPVATTTTDANGDYLFPAVLDGDYTVAVTDDANVLDGYTLTSGLDAIDITVAGADVTDIDFGYVQDAETGSIGDTVFFDADRDGIQDANEGGLGGVTVDLYDAGPDGIVGTADDIFMGTTTTDANGNYNFEGVPAGTYYVDVTDTNGVLSALSLTAGSDPSAPIFLSEGEDYEDADFGYASTTGSAIGDTIFYDADGDGFQDPGEVGIAGVVVNVYDAGPDGIFGTADDILLGTATTDSSGYYLVTGLDPGRVYVEVDTTTLPADYDPTPTNGPAARPFRLEAGQDILFADFGFNGGTTGSIGDTVFLDADGDGVQDAGEPGLSGVTIDLVDPVTGDILATTTTDDNGNYDFVGLEPGSYDVVVTDIDGVLTDLNLSTPPVGTVNLADGEDFNDADFGFAPSEGTGTIGGTVWHDTNQDLATGILDPDESGFEGVTVELWLDVDGDGVITPGVDNLVRTTSTDANGDYSFLGVPFGDYIVDVTDELGVLDGFQNVLGPTPGADNNGQTDPYPVMLSASNTSDFTADFGYEAIDPHILTGTTFFDANGDGIFDDPDEPGVGAVEVFLFRDLDGDGVLDPGEPQIGSTTVSDGTIDVDGDGTVDPPGFYAFTDLPNGDYIVSVDPSSSFLDGLQQTTQTTTAPVQPATIADADSVDNDFGFAAVTTAVIVSDFSAFAEGGAVTVRWETASQTGTVGFYVYRWDRDSDSYLQINEQMHPAILDAPQGAVYELRDETAGNENRLTYVLVEVEVGGAERSYGPYRVTPEIRDDSVAGVGRHTGQIRGARMTARLERMAGELKASRRAPAFATASVSTTGRALPLIVKTEQEGIHFLGEDTIAAATGMSPNRVRRLLDQGRGRLTQGRSEMALQRTPGGFYFYAEAVEDPYAPHNAYRFDFRRGESMKEVVAGGGLGGVDRFYESLRFEQDLFPVTVVPNASVEDFFYWAAVIAGNPNGAATLTLEVPDPVLSTDAVLGLTLQGLTSTPASIDHRVSVLLNGISLGETAWDGATAHHFELEVPAGVLIAGDNNLEIVGSLEGGLPYSTVLVDSARLDYERLLRAAGDALVFNADTPSAREIRGFSSPDVVLFDITNPESPVRLHTTPLQIGSEWVVRFTPGGSDRRFAAYTTAAVHAPAEVRLRSRTNLRRNRAGAEYVVITPTSLTNGAQALANYRRARGLSTLVVTLDEVHDTFSHGVATPHAIQDFLSFAWRRWTEQPSYAVLSGTGTFDYKDIQGVGDNLMPSLMTATPYGLFASDILFGDVAGDRRPEIAIGRIPVMTSAELETYVAKIAASEASAPTDKVLLVADNPDPAGAFDRDSDALAELLPAGTPFEKVYLSTMPVDQARSRLFEQVAEGVGLVNYLGHGGLARFADEGLLTNDDTALLTGPRLPVFATLTCSVGRFEIPGFESLGEALILEPEGGAAVVWAPTGQSLHPAAVRMNEELLRALFDGSGRTVGEAVIETLGASGEGNPFPFMLEIYNLLGDPAYGAQ